MPLAAAGRVAEATAALTLARHELAAREDAWHAAIRVALASGMSGPAVARVAGITPGRVYQIRDGRRTGPTPTREETT